MSRVDWSKWRAKAASLFMAWWDRRDPSKDIHYLAFCVYVVAAVAWLSREQHAHGVPNEICTQYLQNIILNKDKR